jgi:hypothetical protein
MKHNFENVIRTLCKRINIIHHIYYNPETDEFEAINFQEYPPDPPAFYVSTDRSDWIECAGLDPQNATDEEIEQAIQCYIDEGAQDMINDLFEIIERETDQ